MTGSQFVLAFASVFIGMLPMETCASDFPGGLWKEFVYDQPNDLPVVFGGSSRCEGAQADQYCIYLDIWYDDGTLVWGKRATWSPGTHDWERITGAFVPERPIRKIQMHAFLRHGTGTARFANLWLERREGTGDVIRTARRWNRPFADDSVERVDVLRGREIVSEERRVADTTCPSPSDVAPDGFVIWTADASRKVTPLTFPSADDRKLMPIVELELAGRESESCQIQVTTGAEREWTEGGVDLPTLVNESGEAFKGTLSWSRIGYLPRALDPSVCSHPCSAVDNRERWLPDPLLPPSPYRVRKGSTQGLWLTAHADADAVPGVYSGWVKITEHGVEHSSIKLSVRVRKFALPAMFGMRTAFSVMDGYTRVTYPNDFKRMKRRTWDLMLDHRLNPDDISRTEPPQIEDLVYARSRGMNSFAVLNLVPKPTDPNCLWTCCASIEEIASDAFYRELKERLDPYLEKLRRLRLERMGYLYGFDERECEYYEGIDNLWRKLRHDYPELPVMTTARMYRDMARGQTNIPHVLTTDWFCPLVSDWDPATTADLQALGKKVWWYTCCDPHYPYANMASLEAPAVEGRILGWMSYVCHADGLLFWHVNFWEPGWSPLLDANDTYFPLWKTYHPTLCPGDGVFLYPGKEDVYPSIRLAHVRDGVEDYELLQLATQRCGAAPVEAICRLLVKSPTEFSRDPSVLRMARAQLAALIEKGVAGPELDVSCCRCSNEGKVCAE